MFTEREWVNSIVISLGKRKEKFGLYHNVWARANSCNFLFEYALVRPVMDSNYHAKFTPVSYLVFVIRLSKLKNKKKKKNFEK